MAASRAIMQAICIVFALSSSTVVGQSITVSPPSVAATTGEQNVLINCSAQNPGMNGIEWTYSPSWTAGSQTIFNSFYNQSNFDPANFTVNHYKYELQGNQYMAADLFVNVAKAGQAATYRCSLLPATQTFKESSLIVLDPVQCPPQDSTVYPAGTRVNMSCSVNYYHEDSLGRVPTIRIQRSDTGMTIPVNTSTNLTTITVTASWELQMQDDSVEYLCIVSFANNDPEYSDNNCSVAYYVVHGVSEITFYPPSSSENPTYLAVGEQINCTANGRPAPIILWYNEQGAVVGQGEVLTVTQDMQSWVQPVSLLVVANNSIDGGHSYVSTEANYTFRVGNSPVPVQSSGTEAWVIAVAVIVPIVVLTAIGLTIFFVMRHRKKKKSMKKKPPPSSAVYHPTTTTTSSTSYTPVATGEVSYTASGRPPPTSAPRPGVNAHGPPGPDSRNGAARNSPGFGDLGAPTYGGSSQAVNAYPGGGSSLHGSNQALGMGVSMNPNPGYPTRASNPMLNASNASSSRPNYPYNGSNSNLNVSLNLNQNTMAAPGVGTGRQPSVASSSGRSHASSYNAGAPVAAVRNPSDISSMHGSEV